ncbi:hypothetical protein E2C01_050163 [Portunus trituberculatus]|uniref:Uncharacterized protein n=1 Tax=Portunus trituberculatus TaxID=210409 RepID=A0A5B7G7J0_PORTR|nr:hypothetical protein [Portunus trituberculatus]
MTTRSVLTPPSTFSTSTSATSAVLDLIYNQCNTTSVLY